MKKISSVYALIACLLMLASCSGQGKKENAGTSADSTKSDSLTAKYVCPMDSDVVSDHPDTCPKCGMDLEKVK